MHEFSLAQAILDKALSISKDYEGRKVAGVHLRIGQLSCASPRAVEQAFELLAAETVAAGAVMSWETQDVEVVCLACAHTYHPDDAFWTCPLCGSSDTRLQHGDEIMIESVNLEDGAPEPRDGRAQLEEVHP